MKRRRSPLAAMIDGYHTLLVVYLTCRLFFGSWWILGLLHTFAMWLFLPLLLTSPLTVLLRNKYRSALAGLLLLTGILRFAPLPTAIFTSQTTPHDLRVLTFNVWVRNPNIEDSIDWILEQDADVVSLQEFVGRHLEHLPRLLAHYPYHQDVTGNVRLLSRYPFLESERVAIEPSTATWDGRLAVRSVIDVDGQRVSIYALHLSLPKTEQSRFGFNSGIDTLDFILNYDESHRNTQIQNIADRVAADPYPVVLAGDFNTSHTSPILDRLRDVNLRDAHGVVGADWGMTWAFKAGALPLLRIDYIWSSPELKPLRLHRGGYLGSDHHPLVADFSFTRSG